MKSKIVILIIVIMILVFIGIIVFPHLNTYYRRNKEISESELSAEYKGFKFNNSIKYDTIKESLPDGEVKSMSNVTLPVGERISISTISSDNTQVTDMWQESDKTIIVVAPIYIVKK